jgi:hypothetical protein
MDNVSRNWPDFQFKNGEIHDLDIEHYENQLKYALRVALMHDKFFYA